MSEANIPARCDVPPEGWMCSREKGHEGPCAASPISDRQANFFGVAPGAPQPDYVNLEGLRESLLAPRDIVRDKEGWLVHPALPICDEDVRADAFLAAFGIESYFVSMESYNPELVDRYFEDGEPDCSAWTPTPPEGEGWMLLEIYDTEDGPYALFGRRKPEAARQNHREREKVTISEFSDLVQDLVLRAERAGIVVTIETKPLQPLAMRNYEMVWTVRAAR